MAGEVVKFLELVEEGDGEFAHVARMGAVNLIAICK